MYESVVVWSVIDFLVGSNCVWRVVCILKILVGRVLVFFIVLLVLAMAF